ncbi:hypothetical protein ACIQVK_29065 [Streptomyces sp. NPDC090493]|uniref:Rv1733c family protein n=1 Tax=Streptomyces sp. NPDC090493 TaxID=3365964 RepID=UPI003810AB00
MTRPPASTATPVRLWYWRRNPLRRHSDVVEGWILLVFWVLALVCAAYAGTLAAQVTYSASSARLSQVRAVTAVVTDDTATTRASGGKYDDGRVWATVRWTDPDGSAHTDLAIIPVGDPVGTRVRIWADRAGHVMSTPVSGTTATVQAALAGALVAPLAGAAVWAVGKGIRIRLIRRRMAEWDDEWRRVGPSWGNHGGGRGRR